MRASRLLYGSNEILKKAKVDAKKIGNADIITLYKTRVWTFLGAWDGDFHDLSIDEARFFRNQMAKAVLAACDMLLIKNHMYTPSYRQRVNYICELYGEEAGLSEISRWALREKLSPSSAILTEKDMQDLYWRARSVFCEATRKALPGFWRSLTSNRRIKNYLYLHSKQFLVDIYQQLFRHSNISRKGVEIFCAQNLIFLSNDRGNINYERLKEGASILEKWGYLNKYSEDWNYLRQKAAWARNHL